MDIDQGDAAALIDDLVISGFQAMSEQTVPHCQASSFNRQTDANDTMTNSLVRQKVTKIDGNKKPFMTRLIGQVDDDTLRKIALFPHVVSGYVQLFFNISYPLLLIYWLYSFGSSMSSDVEKKVQLFSAEVMEQIAKCSRDYRENRCDPATRVPALISACQAWEECMNRDPHLVAKRSGISAQIVGETMEGFFSALSWKTIVALSCVMVGIVLTLYLMSTMSHRSPREGALLELRPKQKALVNGSQSSAGSRRRRF